MRSAQITVSAYFLPTQVLTKEVAEYFWGNFFLEPEASVNKVIVSAPSFSEKSKASFPLIWLYWAPPSYVCQRLLKVRNPSICTNTLTIDSQWRLTGLSYHKHYHIYILSNTLSLIFWDNFFLHILCFYSRQSQPIWWKCVKTWNMKIWDGKSGISAIR